MREILFRGKQLDNYSWAEGYLFDDGFTNSHRMFIGNIIITDNREYTENQYNVDTYFYEVHPHTIGQFTELYDKNGKRIFEHDIVKISGSTPIISLVKYKNGAFEIVWSRKQNKFIDGILTLHDWIKKYEFEVIGNIFDNPDLLSFEYDESEKTKDTKIKIEFD